MINRKLEDKSCGNGPSLAIVFEDDSEMMELHQEIQVSIIHVVKLSMYMYMYCTVH